MKLFSILIGFIFFLSACNSNKSTESTSNDAKKSNSHKVVVEEVVQTSQYTYLRVKENDTELWLAANSIQAKVGETYYYEGGFKMEKFESKELKKTFDAVILVDNLSTKPIEEVEKNAMAESHGSKTAVEKKDIKVEHIKDGVTVADIYSKKDTYGDKTVKIKGEVVKFLPEIMGKNWIHLQDGTDANGNFDLTITTTATAKVGDVIVVEGKIVLKKDFGYGYSYEVLMEDAVIK